MLIYNSKTPRNKYILWHILQLPEIWVDVLLRIKLDGKFYKAASVLVIYLTIHIYNNLTLRKREQFEMHIQLFVHNCWTVNIFSISFFFWIKLCLVKFAQFITWRLYEVHPSLTMTVYCRKFRNLMEANERPLFLNAIQM